MTKLEDEIPKLEVDAWEKRRRCLVWHYISQGSSPTEAENKATADIRHEIHNTSTGEN